MDVIALSKKTEKLTIEPVEPGSHYIAGAAQKRLYAIHQTGDTTYNMPRVLKLSGPIDKNRIQNVINSLVDRHEAFRTFFKVINGQISQVVQEHVKIDIETGTCLNKDIQKCIQSFIRPFDLERAPLLRVGLYTLSDAKDQYLLILDIHHSIADGESAQILIKEFMELYGGNNLPPLSFQFKEFAHWQARLSKTDLYQKRREFWLSQFRNTLPSLNLPTDFPRPSVQTFKGSRLAFQLSKRSSKQLSDLARSMNVTLYMLVLSIFKILISKYAQQNDIIVGTPASGRQHSEFQDIVGMFVNTLALRSQPDGEKSFPQYVNEIKSLTIKAAENQDYQFDDLIQGLQIERDPSRNPLFDVMFVWHNFQDSQNNRQKLDDLVLETIAPEFSISRFDLTLVAAEKDERLSCSIEYSTTLFKEDRIRGIGLMFILFGMMLLIIDVFLIRRFFAHAKEQHQESRSLGEGKEMPSTG
ncbi:hypothetical protein GF406_06415 [candidate division KSB1 bacterium]|nr:hypothetical protein [candidate division KSB1 bacterium]